MTDEHHILRSTRWLIVINFLNRLSGYVRDLLVAILLGTTLAADAFVVAFRIPNLLRRLMAEGVMNGAFVPVFTTWRVERPEAESWEFARRAFWTLAAVAVGLTVLGVLAAPWLVRVFTAFSPEPGQWSLAVVLTRITLPYCALIALAALAGATLNAVRVFNLPASIPLLLNSAIVVAAVLAWWLEFREPAIALVIGMVLGGVLQLAVQLPALARRGMRFRVKVDFGHPGIRRVARLVLPASAGVGIYQVNILVSTIFASRAEGWISALYYADRVMELALGIYAMSVATVVLPVMSEQAAERKLDALARTMGFSLRIVAFIVVPAAVGLMVLRGPIVRVLFEYDTFGATSTELTAWALLFYALGLPAIAAIRLLVQGICALQDVATPIRVMALALVANVAFCFLLVGPLGQGGLALATSLAAYLSLALLYALFRRRVAPINERRTAVSLARTTVAAAGMGAGCWWLAARMGLVDVSGLGALVGWSAATVAFGILIYLSLAWLLRAEELNEVFTLLTGRLRPAGVSAATVAVPPTPGQK